MGLPNLQNTSSWIAVPTSGAFLDLSAAAIVHLEWMQMHVRMNLCPSEVELPLTSMRSRARVLQGCVALHMIAGMPDFKGLGVLRMAHTRHARIHLLISLFIPLHQCPADTRALVLVRPGWALIGRPWYVRKTCAFKQRGTTTWSLAAFFVFRSSVPQLASKISPTAIGPVPSFLATPRILWHASSCN